MSFHIKFLLFMAIVGICNAAAADQGNYSRPTRKRSSQNAQVPVSDHHDMLDKLQKQLTDMSMVDAKQLNRLDSIENKFEAKVNGKRISMPVCRPNDLRL